MMYDVQLLGNMHHGGRPGYRQEVRTMLGDEHMGSQFTTVVPGDGPDACNHLVLSRTVNADTASGAMRKFRQWQEEGLPESFLTSVPA